MTRDELTTDLEWIAKVESKARRLERINAALLAACKELVVEVVERGSFTTKGVVDRGKAAIAQASEAKDD